MMPEDFASLGFLRFQIARALGGGLDTFNGLKNVRCSELYELLKFAEYFEASDERRAIEVNDHVHWDKWDRRRYLMDVNNRLGERISKEKKEKYEKMEREYQMLNLMIMMGR